MQRIVPPLPPYTPIVTRIVPLLVLSLAVPAAGGAAQEVCAPDAPPISSGAAPPLDEYRTLFQQGGVTFFARVTADPDPTARLVIWNGNAAAVEVSYGVVAVGEGGETPVARRCVRIRGGASLHSIEGTTVFRLEDSRVRDVRIRNLSITQLEGSGGMAPPPGRVQEVDPESSPQGDARVPAPAAPSAAQQERETREGEPAAGTSVTEIPPVLEEARPTAAEPARPGVPGTEGEVTRPTSATVLRVVFGSLLALAALCLVVWLGVRGIRRMRAPRAGG